MFGKPNINPGKKGSLISFDGVYILIHDTKFDFTALFACLFDTMVRCAVTPVTVHPLFVVFMLAVWVFRAFRSLACRIMDSVVQHHKSHHDRERF